MTYSIALARFRKALVVYGQTTAVNALQLSIHSLKATLLTWANLLGIDVALRASGGHRKLPVPARVTKHGRDDISPQLQLQAEVSGSATFLF